MLIAADDEVSLEDASGLAIVRVAMAARMRSVNFMLLKG
jgi:hypothetical protein